LSESVVRENGRKKRMRREGMKWGRKRKRRKLGE
jgi:hypothetical protein